MNLLSTLKGRSFLTLLDYSAQEIHALLALASELKARKKGCPSDLPRHLLEDKNIVLIFDKTSTRTRCSFEVAAFDEGANVTFLTNSQMGGKESVEDTARVLGRMYDGIEYRGFSQRVVENLAAYSGIPVFNGLTDDDHPTQVLADFLTAQEHVDKPLEAMKLVYVGDGRNNVANALLIGGAKVGMDVTVSSPRGLFPDSALLEKLSPIAAASGSLLSVEENPYEAVKGADIIYTDVWVSMGEEDKARERVALLKAYQVNEALLEATGNPKVIFEHCLPAYHDRNTVSGAKLCDIAGMDALEVTDDVFRGAHSVVFDEAENRMHTIKAVMVASLSDKLPR
ncbi:ornithine carbamoyltransferase [Parasphaerochaeta coccoides]|uniref:Ornithine carbamoyltransferase, catabolic n=1 Tax=Parasphaerochaeta coccoides (strain ATCC BAA-1237 / DSM 17374 / SPN1) TaxID=760011 RepID=F4GKQ4_PARC1|nr:ornithine carbamoyltransferase [Parasphaerochaeta coccoides]AEC01463.1 ornithine carbamoyltransferase [Parasphaerochaeta coccoides DSM 17374]